jgi:hypothetical protein
MNKVSNYVAAGHRCCQLSNVITVSLSRGMGRCRLDCGLNHARLDR